MQARIEALETELAEARAQQTAAAEVLQVINSSPGDLAPVFNAMLEKAMRLCEAVFGMLFLYDGKRFRAVVTEGVPEQAALLMRQPHPPPGFTMPILAGEPLLHIADVTALAGPEEAINRASVELGGVRTLLVVPLRKEGVLLGAIAVFRQEVRQFSVRQIALLQNFAAQAVIAMENARLITETREALDQQTATAEVLGVINSSPGNLAPVFDAMIEKAVRLCGAVHGVLRIFDGEVFHLAAVHGDPDVVARLKRLGPVEVSRAPTGDLMGRIARGDRLVHVADVRETDTYRDLPDARERLDVDGIRTWLAVALHKEETLLGVIVAYRREVRPFSDREISLLENFAAQAVIAMENARLLGELHARTDEIAGWNRELEARVAAQLAEIERTGKLRRFLAPQLADLIVAQGDESILESHRREIVVVFCDLRGFTGFAERAEPEEVMALLRDYHAAMGPIVARFEGTIDHYGGDGIMVFFNDPVPTPDPARRAIDMAVAMREAAQELLRNWRRHGHDIGFGVGISQGYATLGQIGFAERMDYTAIGTVTNLAARLCAEATDGQILVSARVAIAVEDSAALEEIGDLSLKGLSQAVAVYNVVAVGAPASAS
jgi:adenylate cyclase